MKRATITDTKNRLSAYLAFVRHGETVLITDRGKPVARLEPAVGTDKESGEGRRQRLESTGVVSASSKKLSKAFFGLGAVKPGKKADIVKALLEERAEGR